MISLSKVINYIDLINKIERENMIGNGKIFYGVRKKYIKRYSKLMEWWNNEK